MCLSPAVFELKDGKPGEVSGFERPVSVRLPKFAQPAVVRGKHIRAPRSERAIAVMKQVGKWTWNSLGIAACIHLVAVVMALFLNGDMRRAVEYIQKAEIENQTAAALVPAPEPDEQQAPDIETLHDDLVMPDQILEDPEILAGDPEFEAPPEEIPYAPEPQVAPPTPAPPSYNPFKRPMSDQGLGGGQPNPGKDAPAGSGLFKNRNGDNKAAAIREHGGGDDTESAVNLGLEYLAKQQSSTGSWDPNEGFKNRPSWATSENGYRGAITALCTLPFLAAGNSPEQGRYHRNVDRAVKWLMKQQTSDGCIAYKNISQMYTHAVATLVLCEAYGMDGDEELGDAAERAVRFLERTQGNGGGWDYTGYITSSGNANSYERNDLSITGWGVLALKSAKAVGIKVNERTWTSLIDLYDRHSLESGETYYADRSLDDLHATRKGIGMVGVGLTARVVLGHQKFETRNYAAERMLLKNAPDYERFFDPSYGASDPNFNTFYGWYYGTLGMFLLNEGRGPGWEKWNTAIKSALLDHQVKKGSREGSWPADDSWIGPIMGDLYSTSLAVLCLEVYYRYNPMHRPAGEISERPQRKSRNPVNPPRIEPEREEKKPSNAVVIGGETLDLDQAGHRSKYLRLLARDKGLGAVPTLLKHLEDESISVRSTALREIGKLKAKDAVTSVQEMLGDPDDQPIVLTVMDTLGAIGDRSVHPSLVRLLSSSDDAIREGARSALGKLSGGKDFGSNKRAWEDWFARNP
ncbi:MAG: HEAT repeat domain-containing protein [Planctomycetes bacterium]|nr:HEAT repeat domain-containing protein [Planctomycetota bacterium]MCB9936393.1 HEAT repeat domain-containing protein [Planctomycetota bacterium]